MHKYDIRIPDTLEELIENLKGADESTKLISGGTDIIIKLRSGRVKAETLIDVSNVKDLNYINEDEEIIRIGAAMTHTEVSENDLVLKYTPALAKACSMVGSTQIRNRGTIAGNVKNASPVADTITPLIAMDASLKVVNSKGDIYTKKVDELVIGLGKTNIKNDEVIIEIIVPKQSAKVKSAFTKIGSRKAVTISKLNGVALVEQNEQTDIIEKAIVTIGVLDIKAFRSKIAEEVLVGSKPSLELFNKFAKTLIKQVDIAIPTRSSRHYKREAIRGIAYDIFVELFGNEVLGGGNNE